MARQEDDTAGHERALPAQVAPLLWTDIPATADRLHALRRRLGNWAVDAGATEDLAESLILAVDEAMSNAVNHAYEAQPAGTFDLHATHDPDHNAIRVTVRDHGRWQEVDPGSLGGRGLVLIRALAHEATIERTANGTAVRMTWLLA